MRLFSIVLGMFLSINFCFDTKLNSQNVQQDIQETSQSKISENTKNELKKLNDDLKKIMKLGERFEKVKKLYKKKRNKLSLQKQINIEKSIEDLSEEINYFYNQCVQKINQILEHNPQIREFFNQLNFGFSKKLKVIPLHIFEFVVMLAPSILMMYTMPHLLKFVSFGKNSRWLGGLSEIVNFIVMGVVSLGIGKFVTGPTLNKISLICRKIGETARSMKLWYGAKRVTSMLMGLGMSLSVILKFRLWENPVTLSFMLVSMISRSYFAKYRDKLLQQGLVAITA